MAAAAISAIAATKGGLNAIAVVTGIGFIGGALVFRGEGGVLRGITSASAVFGTAASGWSPGPDTRSLSLRSLAAFLCHWSFVIFRSFDTSTRGATSDRFVAMQTHRDLSLGAGRRSGTTLSPGPVSKWATTDDKTGCATLRTELGRAYRPAEPKVRWCVLPWNYLDAITGGAVGAPVDVGGLIKGCVPEQVRPLVDNNPDTTCADAPGASNVHDHPTGRTLRTNDRQPFPFYGVITVSRA